VRGVVRRFFQQLTRAACQLQHQRGHPTTKPGTDPEEDAHALDNFCNRAIAVASGLGFPRCRKLDSPVAGGSRGHPGDPVDHRTQSSCLTGEDNFPPGNCGGRTGLELVFTGPAFRVQEGRVSGQFPPAPFVNSARIADCLRLPVGAEHMLETTSDFVAPGAQASLFHSAPHALNAVLPWRSLPETQPICSPNLLPYL
jgi:hypothetical protein